MAIEHDAAATVNAVAATYPNAQADFDPRMWPIAGGISQAAGKFHAKAVTARQNGRRRGWPEDLRYCAKFVAFTQTARNAKLHIPCGEQAAVHF